MTIKSLEKIIVLVVFCTLQIIYISTAARVPVGYADSDELITTAYLHSVAHPPGYGINLFLINAFQHLFPFISPAFSAHIFAGVLHALTITIICATALLIISNLNLKKEIHSISILGCGAGSITAGLVGLFWLYSSLIEVMSLGDLFVALIIYGSTKWYFSARKPMMMVVLISILYGLGISHLQSLIVLAPCLLYILISRSASTKNRVKRYVTAPLIAIIITAGFFIIGSLSIIPRNNAAESFSWYFPPTINGWWRIVTRADYQGFFPEKNTTAQSSYLGGFGTEKLKAIPLYLSILINQYAGILILLPIGGILFLWRKQRKYGIGILLMYLLGGLLFSIYVTPVGEESKTLGYRLLVGVSERQYLIGFTVFSLFTVLGTTYGAIMIQNIFRSKKTRNIVTAAILVATPLCMFLANHSLANQSSETTVYRYAGDLLSVAAPNSVIICTGDISCFSLMYKNLVEKQRSDVVILEKISLPNQKLLNQKPEYIGYSYRDNPFFYAQAIVWNVAHRPTYITNLEAFMIQYVGLDANPFYVVPKGRMFQIQTQYPTHDQFETTNDSNLVQLVNRKPDVRDYYKNGLSDYFASIYLIQAQLYTKYGLPQPAISSLENSLALNDTNQLIIEWRMRINEFSQTARYDSTARTSSSEYLAESRALLENNQYDQAYIAARKAYYLDPKSKESLEMLIMLYQKNNYTNFATTELHHLETLDRYAK